MNKNPEQNEARKNYLQDMTELEISKYVVQLYEHWLDIAQEDFRRWRMNALFCAGVHWAVWSQAQSRLVIPTPPRGKVRITFNLIKPWLLDTEAKYDIALPEMFVLPNTGHQDQKDAAIASEMVGQHLWRVVKMRKKNRLINRYNMHYGDCLGMWDWDETIGPRVQQTSRILDARGETQSVEIISLGDLRLDILLPYNYFTDEHPGELDQKFYLGTVDWYPLDQIRNTWDDGYKVMEVKKLGPVQDAMEALHSSSLRKRDYREHTKGSPVIRMLFKPQRACENGRIVTIGMGGNVVLEDGPWPEQYAQLDGYPAKQFSWYKHPNMWRPPAPVEDQIPINREINITRSQIIEAKNMMTALKLLVPDGSGVSKWTDLSGQLIRHTPGLAPSYLQPPNFPQYIFRHHDETVSALEDVQMRHQASRGSAPPGVKSGTGILNLAEQDDRPLSIPEAEEHEDLSDLFRKGLQIYAQAVSEKRMLRFVGKNKRRQVRAFLGSDLRGNHDIHVGVSGGGSKSRSGVQAFYLESLKAGAFRRPDGTVDDRKYFEIMRHSIPDLLYEEVDRDEELAQNFIDMLEDPDQVAPFPEQWDNHRVLLAAMEEHMRDMSWRKKANLNPVVMQRFMRFYQQLLSYVAGQPPQELIAGGSSPASQPGGQGPLVTEGV